MSGGFAKPAIDVGMATNLLEEQQGFWGRTVGLTYDHMARLGGGFRQHRYMQGDSIVKVNHTRDPLEATPAGGYAGLTLASALRAELRSPDGVPVHLRPREETGADLTLHVRTPDLDAFARFYGEILGLAPDGPAAFRLGGSRVVGEEGPAPGRHDQRDLGLRYMTVQIFDCDAVTSAAEAMGAEIGGPPRTLGSVRYSFLRDPDGNWIELSERESLTGKPVKPD